jgi:hypothetical protein
MLDENNPVMYMEYSEQAFYPTTWQSLLPYAVKLNVKDGGILKTAEAALLLKNTEGRFTGQGSITINEGKFIRFRTDVRGTIDRFFDGQVYGVHPYAEGKNEYLEIVARGIDQPLNKDTITKDYLDECKETVPDWKMNTIIEDLLANPDSGVNKNFAVSASGLLTTTPPKHNFNKENLYDAIRRICEYVGYGGHAQVWTIPSPFKLMVLQPYGTTQVSPAITIPQTALERDLEKSIDEVYNMVMVHGGGQLRYPHADFCCENGVAKGYWTGLSGNTVSDVDGDCQEREGNNRAIRIDKPEGETYFHAKCTLPILVDLAHKHIKSLTLYAKVPSPINETTNFTVILYDDFPHSVSSFNSP